MPISKRAPVVAVTVDGWRFASHHTHAQCEDHELDVVREEDGAAILRITGNGLCTLSPNVISEMLRRIPQIDADRFINVLLALPKLNVEADFSDQMSLLFDAWHRLDPYSAGMTVKKFLDIVIASDDPQAQNMQKTVLAILGKGRPVNPQTFGQRLRRLRKRVFKGRYIDYENTRHRYALWKIYETA